MKIDVGESILEKHRWKLVNAVDCTDIDGEIHYADPNTGNFAILEIAYDAEDYCIVESDRFRVRDCHWSPNSFKIVRR